jgi:nucleotide-binding universal stress UspA family protein
MYKKVLVPVDGSQFSQCGLDQVRAIARGLDVPDVILLRVVEPIPEDDRSGLLELAAERIPELEKIKDSIALEYVSSMAKKLGDEGLHTRGEIAHGKAAEEIIKYAENNKCDLIIMGTHGRSGVTLWTMGSVAEKVANHSAVPVQLVSPRECRTKAGF